MPLYLPPSNVTSVSSGPINVNTLTSIPLVGDGKTANYDAWRQIMQSLYRLGAQSAPVAVTLTSGSPCVVNWTGHRLIPNQAFYFDASSTLPTGVQANTPYFVTFTNLTANTFTFSEFNNWEFVIDQPEGAPVTSTGSSSGVSIVLTGINPIDLYIPPGTYATQLPFGNATDRRGVFPPIGVTNIRWNGYGVVLDDLCWLTPIGNIGTVPWPGPSPLGWQIGLYDYINTVTMAQTGLSGPYQITLKTSANADRYKVGSWIAIMALDVQDGLNTLESGPPNNHYFEWNQITSISGGVITLKYPLRFGYLDTLPNLYNQVSPGEGGGGPGGGPGIIIPMNSGFDAERQVVGVTFAGLTDCFGRRYEYKDCIFPFYVAPGWAREAIYRNCQFPPYARVIQAGLGVPEVEVDKMIEYLEFERCHGTVHFSSTSCTNCVVKGHLGSIDFTPRNIAVEDSILDSFTVGNNFLGATDSIQLRNSRVMRFDWFARDDGPNFPGTGKGNAILANWTFSNGTFSRDLSTVPASVTYQNWAIPGAKYFLCDTAGHYDNMGSVFAILNCYLTGSVFSFDTTLKAIPTRQKQSAVTMTIASPGVVTWNSHGLAAGTPVLFTFGTDVLPTGLAQNTVYFVASSPAPTTNTFSLAATSGGAAINTTGTQSGTHTLVANPLHIMLHPCPRFTSIGNSGSQTVTDMNGAVDEPIFSRWKRSYVGFQSTDEINYQEPTGRLWGKLVSMTVTVQQPATSGTLSITCPGFVQPNLALNTFSQTIDLTTTGTRIVTPGGVTALGTDSLTAYGDWLSAGNISGQAVGNTSKLQVLPSGTPVGLQNQAIVEIEFLTDQGLTRFSTMHGYDTLSNNTGTYVDSSIRTFYPK